MHRELLRYGSTKTVSFYETSMALFALCITLTSCVMGRKQLHGSSLKFYCLLRNKKRTYCLLFLTKTHLKRPKQP